MKKMNPEVKAKWVAALRSGEYKQVRNRLRANGSHCCLGVLCDLFAQASGKPAWRTRDLSDASDGRFAAVAEGDPHMPSARVGMWAGLDFDRKVRINGKARVLNEHNDEGRTFSEIADAIEAQL